MNTPLNKPCLVQTGQGFSVEYQGKLLYSKYNPSRNILRTIENLNLLPETLLICLSPVLDYGVREIIQKVNLSQNSRCLFLEKDRELFELEKNWLNEKSIKENFCLPQELLYYSNNMDLLTTAQRSVSKPGESLKDPAESLSSNKCAAFLLAEEAPSFIPFFYRNFKGEFKRVQIIDFSAASALYKEEYFTFFTKLQNIVNQFWKNRITLIKFGKKYSGNLLKNLKNLSLSCKTQSQNKKSELLTRKDLSEKNANHWTFPQSSKILLVAGAGESALSTLEWIKKSHRRENFYIIAVDALIKTLKALNIKADALVCEESQAVIARALTGCQNFFDTLFLSITANTSVARKYLTKTIFYTPLYTNSRFLSSLATKGLVQNTFDPLGSVGLTALNIALKIRKNENIPVIVTGLDFSYSKNRTHAPSSFHDRENYKKLNRLTTIEKFQSAFSQFSKIAWPCKKQGQAIFETFYTLPSLENYKNLFTDRFSSCKNLYDAGI
nr:DUF115 domain-containing protein [Treponema sp.]